MKKIDKHPSVGEYFIDLAIEALDDESLSHEERAKKAIEYLDASQFASTCEAHDMAGDYIKSLPKIESAGKERR